MMREGKSAGMLLIGMMAVGMLLGGLAQGLAEAARITKEPTGFNGYTWGTPLVQVAGLTRVTDPKIAEPLPGVEVYEKPGEVLTLNGVMFTRVLYRFYKSQLGGIQLTYEGKENRDKLIQWIEEQYGKLPPVERKQKQIEWHGESTVITLGYDVVTKLGQLWFTYLVLTPFDNSTTDTSGY
jgi:hypothetical protein